MKRLSADEVSSFVQDVLFDPGRTIPVVAVTTRPRGEPWVDAGELERAVADRAEVVLLETGEATWSLAEHLPSRLDVYGGAVRIWWPELGPASDPRHHPLLFAYSQAQGRELVARVLVLLERGPYSAAASAPGVSQPAVRQAPGTAPRAPDTAAEASEPAAVQQATVVAVDAAVELDVEGGRGVLAAADLPLRILRANLVSGQRMPVRALPSLPGAPARFTAQGLLPSPWERIAAELQVGDVITGRVQNVTDFGAFVELLPRVTGLLHVSEMDWDRVEDPRDYARPGQQLNVQIVAMNVQSRRIELSLKRAYGSDPRQPLALLPDGPPFRWPEHGEGSSAATSPNDPSTGSPEADLQGRIDALSEELEAAGEERASMAAQLKSMKQQVAEAKRELRSEQDRARGLERRLALEDPLASERAFLLAVRLCHARMLEEDDRQRWPLRRMRVGSAFLASLRALDGIDVAKVVEVCAQVACDLATTLPGREVHQLREGSRGASGRVRADAAKAWRCSLQDNTPGARRLHWWSIPGPGGGVIEFASVGVHDDYSIPE